MLINSLLATFSLLHLYNVMCKYTTAEIIHDECARNPHHKVVKRLFKRCPNRPKPGPRCDNPTLDRSLGVHFPSHRMGPCKFCRDSGASVGAERYQDVCSDSVILERPNDLAARSSAGDVLAEARPWEFLEATLSYHCSMMQDALECAIGNQTDLITHQPLSILNVSNSLHLGN